MSKPFLTIGDIAKQLGLPQHRINYHISRHNIDPATRAGIVRLFTPDQVERIRKALISD